LMQIKSFIIRDADQIVHPCSNCRANVKSSMILTRCRNAQMSAFGYKQTSGASFAMSALAPESGHWAA